MSSLFQRIDTVFLSVKNFSESIDWYTKILGFPVRWRDDKGGYACLDVSETPLTLRRVPEDTDFIPNNTATFNFYVADVVAARQHLKEANVEVGEIVTDGNVSWFWFKDFDGNRLEVCSF